MSDLFLRIIQHLLPRGRAWLLTIDKTLRQFFEGLTGAGSDARDFIDDVYDDGDPQRTRELDMWEAQFGLQAGSLTEQERRDRLDGAWSAVGGQDPRYIQDTLQAAGFDVYIHEWWIPGTTAPVPRNPFTALGEVTYIQCGEPEALCGEPEALCGNVRVDDGYLLTNRGLGTYTPPAIPGDDTKWPYILYFGGASFGDPADVPSARRLEFETLLLQICPAQQWLGMMINYV